MKSHEMYMMLFGKPKKNNPVLATMVNFKNAFGSVSFYFINVTQELFGFGPVYRQGVNILLGQSQGFKGVTIVNGHVSEQFPINRGCRQGNHITGYLCVLCIEVLILLVQNWNVKPYQTKTGHNILNDTYADNLTIYLKYKRYDQHFNTENTRTLLDCLKKFEKWSGLKVNEGKTQVTVFGGKY